MELRKYAVIFGLICSAVLMTVPSYVQASEAVFDEIEKYVSPVEELQFDKPIQNDISEEQPADTEEQYIENDEEKVEAEDTPKNTKTEQPAPAKTTADMPKQQDISVETPQTNETNVVKTVSEEKDIIQYTNAVPIKHHTSVTQIFKTAKSKLVHKCSSFFSGLSFDKIITLKETIIQYLSSNQFIGKLYPKEVTEHKPIENPRAFVPYYFLYPDFIKNLFENIAFPENINNLGEILPYLYTVKNYEVKLEIPKNAVTPEGTEDIRVLLNAPSPKIKVVDKSLFAKIVVDIRNNTLYKYDEYGFPLKAYLIATGARGTRTRSGLRIVTYKEKFPYRGAPKNCKRLFDPYSYGPYIIFLNAVNPKTGRQTVVDQFLHGNGNERSIGRKVSHGCMRMNNKVMRQEISKEVNRGDYVLLINPD